ncbi:hypothetical protein JDV02_003209 [Purpureocillium takamizusanense]|uniref:Uncharacterized protein n=1 Tax=Purpureocillium takamizusanense TaxID=2060973 RepID=A0A9Q8QA72_9HYPO|nr:uncharacterized protein JDV02_003209 [Purpureocillium takamizusanense]UNI16809.1 hypothetical protein JDV02_003209 [Purpureocillium takamizusanense]
MLSTAPLLGGSIKPLTGLLVQERFGICGTIGVLVRTYIFGLCPPNRFANSPDSHRKWLQADSAIFMPNSNLATKLVRLNELPTASVRAFQAMGIRQCERHSCDMERREPSWN